MGWGGKGRGAARSPSRNAALTSADIGADLTVPEDEMRAARLLHDAQCAFAELHWLNENGAKQAWLFATVSLRGSLPAPAELPASEQQLCCTVCGAPYDAIAAGAAAAAAQVAANAAMAAAAGADPNLQALEDAGAAPAAAPPVAGAPGAGTGAVPCVPHAADLVHAAALGMPVPGEALAAVKGKGKGRGAHAVRGLY